MTNPEETEPEEETPATEPTWEESEASVKDGFDTLKTPDPDDR